MNMNQNEKNLLEIYLIRKFLSIVDKSSFHGIPNVFKAERTCTRLMWILFTTFSTAICVWLCNKNVLNYLDYNKVTNIDVIYEQPMLFPTISICSCMFNISLPLNIFIKSCVFNNDVSCKVNPKNSFVSFIDARYGLCYRFNSGKTMNGSDIDLFKTSIAGRSGGLQIEAYENNGLLLFIHNSSILPYQNENYNNINGDSIFVSTGFATDIIIEKVFTERLPEPYNECVKTIDDFHLNKTLYQLIVDSNLTYSQQRCYKLCFDLDYITNNPCNCTKNVTIGNVWQKCFTEKEKENLNECTFKYKAKFNKLSLADMCNQYCPLECDSAEFKVTYSFHLTETIPRNDTLKFKAYYKELKYIYISQEEAMNLIDLISGIGGILGLFLGVSFLSFIEIFELIFEIFYLITARFTSSLKKSAQSKVSTKNEFLSNNFEF